MMATLRRSGFATEGIPSVYQLTTTVLKRSANPGQNFSGALAELLVLDHALRVVAGVGLALQVVGGHRDVKERRRHLAAAFGDVLFAALDLAVFAGRRIVRGANVGDLLEVIRLRLLQTTGRLDEHFRGFVPDAQLGK